MTKTVKQLTLLFLREDNRILLAMKKRGFGVNRWNGVGGKVEADESLEMAMVRETQEEIGVTPINYKKVGDIRFDEFFKGEPTLMHVHVFVANQWEGSPTETEEMKPAWFDVNNIPYAQMWPDDPYWLPLVVDGYKVSADFTLDENDVIISSDVQKVEELPARLE
ncbi:MAG: 7,8-dihydro-8-oxoguanine triphosphatase-like [Candidatus Saccharibacteria bacterium]|nr:7,8-dihydro-8-oxoguanine triphosphatase-like [Candidatus Saccharibacteria bacterium]